LWAIFALLNPDPDFESGYGSTDLIESGSNPFPDPGSETLFINLPRHASAASLIDPQPGGWSHSWPRFSRLFSFLKSIKHIYIFVKVQTYYKYNYADKKREKYVSFTKVNKKLSKCRHKCIAMSWLLRNFIESQLVGNNTG
jgi:hypothetical protein